MTTGIWAFVMGLLSVCFLREGQNRQKAGRDRHSVGSMYVSALILLAGAVFILFMPH